ncbi:hypothetical protein ABBQ32_014072 [Trebouxia sp. C0010 RCD-2024]
MHPRTQYLADAGGKHDPAQQPLLQDRRRADEGSAEEPAASSEKDVAAPSAPPLTPATSPAPPSSPTSGYGLPTGYQAQYAEAPPELQSFRPSNQAMPPVNQPVQSYRMQTLGSFDDEPAIITCTQCRATGQTYTYQESGCCVWFSAITCIFLGCWPCAWMPFCFGSCKDTVHRCSNCGRVVGKHAWGR